MSNNQTTTKKRPIQEIRIGAIKASVWEHQQGDFTRHNVTFSKFYKEGDDWKVTEYFGRDDLLAVAKVADQAHSWICDQRAAKS